MPDSTRPARRSVNKTFTGTLLARAVLSGRVTLDTPVARLLPEFKIPSRGGREITLGDLATHHSGLPPRPLNMLPKDRPNPFAHYDTEQLRAFLAHYELPRDPGAAFEYSDVGFGLLGHALAQLEHTSYAAATDEIILRPLGMTMSGTASTDALRAHLVPGHDSADKPAMNWDIPGLAGTGALRSTARDMLRYLKANMGIERSPLAAAMKLAQQPRRDMDKTTHIGLAWRISEQGIVWHPGMTWGYRTFVGFTSDGRRGVVILSNTAADTDDLGFATLVADAPLAPPLRAIVLPAASLDDYEGTYRLADTFLLTVFRMNDGLFARLTGLDAFPILPSAPNEFFGKAWGIGISFTRDAGGAVNGLVLHQNGTCGPQNERVGASIRFGNSRSRAAARHYVGKTPDQILACGGRAKADRLKRRPPGSPPFPISSPSARQKFFYKIVDMQLDFERDAGGKVVAVVLHGNGGHIRAPRVVTR